MWTNLPILNGDLYYGGNEGNDIITNVSLFVNAWRGLLGVIN